jgi:CRISPR-associated protein Csb3
VEFRVATNRMNPAEYFASLGCLELLSHQDPALLSHFEGEGNRVSFVVQSEKDIALPELRALPIAALEFDDPYTAPILVNGFRLDWWLDLYKEEASSLKLWAGTTTPAAMLKNYQSMMNGEQDENMLGFSVMTKTKSTFNLDTRASRNPIRVGYSQKDAGEKSVVYPYAEFLTALGLQNFRPLSQTLQYFTWARPLRTSIAHAACRQGITGLRSKRFKADFMKVSQGMREVQNVSELSLDAVVLRG